MKKQKICIIGDGLTGLTTALGIAILGIQVDLYLKKKKINKKDIRTTAVSESSYQFLKSILHCSNLNYTWPCKDINLYYENNDRYLNFLNYKENKIRLMHIFQNYKLRQNLIKKILINKNIKTINQSINNIDYNENKIKLKNKEISYDLIILSTGSGSKLFEKVTNKRSIIKDYKETAITAIIKHNLKIKGASQFFLKEGPLAILPFKKNFFSIVWSLDNEFFQKNKNYIKQIISKKIQNLFLNKKKIEIKTIQFFPIQLDLKTKYYNKNVLILGDALHSVHPIAGQGFNLVIKDIKKLIELISDNQKNGIQLKDSYLLKNFSNARKPENIIFGLGINLTNTFFKKNYLFSPIRKTILMNINKFNVVKKISKLIANQGIIK